MGGMIDLGYRTLLEAGQVPPGALPLPRLAGGPRRRAADRVEVDENGSYGYCHEHCGVLSPWARGIVAGVSLREGDRSKFRQRFALDNPLEDAAVLELSGAVPLGSSTAVPSTDMMPGTSSVTRSEHPRLWHISDPILLLDIPAGSIDVLVCEATWLSRISPTWLRHHGQMLKETRGDPVPVRVEPEAREARSGMVSSYSTCDLQRDYLRWLLGHFKHIVTSTGICVLAYQHVLPSAWETLCEALLDSGWCCSGAVPFPASPPPYRRDVYLYPRWLAWDALLVCRPNVRLGSTSTPGSVLAGGPVDPAGPPGISCLETQVVARIHLSAKPQEPIVVDLASLGQALARMRTLCGVVEKRRMRMGCADRLNLWRALVVAYAYRGDKVGPADPLQAEHSAASLGPSHLGQQRSPVPQVSSVGCAEWLATAQSEPVLLTDALRSEPDWNAK